MDKVAMYKEEIMEKVASRAWKRNFSENNRERLENSGILNHEKELGGLNKGTDEIIRKNNIQVTNHDNPKGLAKEINKRIKKNELLKAQGYNSKDVSKQMAQNGAAGGYYFGFPDVRGNHLLNIGGVSKNIYTKNNVRGDNSLHDRYLNGLIKRHETDEVREGIKQMNNPKKHLRFKDDKVALGALSSGHDSANVIGRESANVAIAPKDAKNTMTGMRNATYETNGLRAAGHEYGRSGVFDKKLFSKINKDVVKQNKPYFSNMIDNAMKSAKKPGALKELLSKLKGVSR
jgi:hypothetical protein